MINYVVGFVFDEYNKRVLLIKKNRPEWQVGKYNGVGGKVEDNETPYEAMVRECEEECGLLLYNWLLVDTFTDDIDYTVSFFTIQTPSIDKAYTKTDEIVEILNLEGLFESCFGMDIIVYPANALILEYYRRNTKEV